MNYPPRNLTPKSRWGCWGKRIRHSLQVSGGSGVAVGGSPSSVSFSMASSGSGRLSASVDRNVRWQKVTLTFQITKDISTPKTFCSICSFRSQSSVSVKRWERVGLLQDKDLRGDPTPVFACAAEQCQSILINYYFRIIHLKIRVAHDNLLQIIIENVKTDRKKTIPPG